MRARIWHRVGLALVCGLFLGPAAAQEKPAEKPVDKPAEKPAAPTVLAFRAAMVYPVAGAPIPNGVVLVSEGKITAVGASVPIPPGAELLDAGAGAIVPGLVECLGGAGIGDRDRGASAGLEADVLDAVDPYDKTPGALLAAGVTAQFLTLRGAPGARPALVRTRTDPGLPEILRQPGALRLAVGRPEGGEPAGWSKAGDVLRGPLEAAKARREALEKYQKELADYQKQKEEWDKKRPPAPAPGPTPTPSPTPSPSPSPTPSPAPSPAPGPPSGGPPGAPPAGPPKRPDKPAPDPAGDAWIEVLAQKTVVRVEVHRAIEIRSVLAVAREFEIRLVLEGASEAADAVHDIVAAKAGVLLHVDRPDGIPGRTMAAPAPGLAARLIGKGIPVALTLGGDAARGSRHLRLAAASAVAEGCPADAALRAITLGAAEACGAADLVGTLEKGRAADLVVLSGPPLDVRSRIVAVVAAGKRVR